MRVLLLENNLMMLSRIRASLQGYEVHANKDYEGEEVALINLEAFPVEKVRELKQKGAYVIGYCGHKNTPLMEKARQAGADAVIPNSQAVRVGELIRSLIK